MGKTMSEKILAKATGKETVNTDDVIWAKLHVLSMLDSVDAEWFEKHSLKVWDPKRIVFCFDHFMDSSRGESFHAIAHPKIREFARKQGIPKENVYDVGRHGISHQVPAEEGWVLPGTFYAGADTQAATMGGLNCYAVFAGAQRNASMVTGEMWLVVPECVKITLTGKLPRYVLGKDIYFRLIKDIMEVAGTRVLEFIGPGLESIPIDVRMGVANGAPHIGAATMVFGPDQKLIDYIKPRAREPFQTVSPDSDAEYVASYDYDLSKFEPLVSVPDAPMPLVSGIKPISEVQRVKVQAGYIGSCNSGRMEDLTQAAEQLKGKKIHPDVRLVVTPISSNVMREATKKGLLGTFLDAGATITTPGCGACFYGNQSPLMLADGEVCITTSTENWPARMGSDKAKIYLANAAVVAASAVRGEITGPRR